ncbi:MAG: 5'-methylthioadenosine/adenosylhomocysteine nucleosidase [Candidatus Gastranaerophilaceae bacterium]
MKTKIFYSILFLLFVFFITGYLYKNQKETVAIIGAMDVEIEEILTNLSDVKYKQQPEFKIITGNLGKYKIILSKSGVGKVSSATTTQFIIDKYKPIYIINIGIAGGLSPDLKAGDTIIAEKMVQHDFDVTAFGNPKGYIDNGIEPNKPTIFYSDKNLINKFTEDSSLKLGTVATGDIFVTDVNLKNSIKKEFSADAIDMESAAIAQTASRNNIPVIILRTISDGLNEATTEYKQNKQTIAKKTALTTVKILESDKIPTYDKVLVKDLS